MFSSPFLSCIFFPYLFHRFSIARIPSGCVCMHLAVGREGKEESHFFPLRPLLWFPKVVGRQLLSACRRVSARCHVSAVSTSRLASAPTGEGRARVVVAFLSRWSVQLWSKRGADEQPDNAFLLCFQPCQCFASVSSAHSHPSRWFPCKSQDQTAMAREKPCWRSWDDHLAWGLPPLFRGDSFPQGPRLRAARWPAGLRVVVGSQVCGHLGGMRPHRHQKV